MCKQHLNLSGYVKVRLTYRSSVPHTEAALTLQKLGVKAPFTEDVRVLVAPQSAFSSLDAYRAPFEMLRGQRIVPPDAELTAFAFDDEDVEHLAYEISTPE